MRLVMRVSLMIVVISIDNPTQKTPWQARSCRVPLAFYALMEYDALQMVKPRIYVDADACPVKDEIYRVAARHALPVSVVAGNFASPVFSKAVTLPCSSSAGTMGRTAINPVSM